MIILQRMRNEAEAVRAIKFDQGGITYVDVRVWRIDGEYVTPMASGITLAIDGDQDRRETLAGLATVLSQPMVVAMDSSVLTAAFAVDHAGHQGDGGEHAAH